ncbi:MAG: sulfite exporter TauE/SafE family protein [Cyclobacteriaceae bacterium]|jgi:hypothetical protein|nr:sulfite exporter TauE/SafE family protein [Cyclobacteriaceae bacterium]
MLWSALFMGLAGSLHCVGMCSPLAATVASLHRWKATLWIYNGARIVTYGVLGAALALVGGWLSLPRFQSAFAMISGLCILLLAVGVAWPAGTALGKPIAAVSGRLRNVFTRQLQQHRLASVAVMGMLNGLLPCGLVYLALLNTLSARTPAEGFGWMVIFGVGTGPAMMGAGWVVATLQKRFSISARTWATVSMLVCGLLLVSRAYRDVFQQIDGHAGHLPITVCAPVIF